MVESTQPAQIDLEIHDLLNQIRANPQMLIPSFTKMLKNFDGTFLIRPGKNDINT